MKQNTGFGCVDMNFAVVRDIMQSNPENTVGVLTIAGKGVRVLVNSTSDLGYILAYMHGLFLQLNSFNFNYLMFLKGGGVWNAC